MATSFAKLAQRFKALTFQVTDRGHDQRGPSNPCRGICWSYQSG